VALAHHSQHPVAIFLAEVSDIGTARFEDPQPEEALIGL
jgi:hypothetical protein